jgi:hypothetical protein
MAERLPFFAFAPVFARMVERPKSLRRRDGITAYQCRPRQSEALL